MKLLGVAYAEHIGNMTASTFFISIVLQQMLGYGPHQLQGCRAAFLATAALGALAALTSLTLRRNAEGK